MPARKPSLRAVAPDEKRARRLTVAEAAEVGTPREELVALRARIAKAIDDPDIRGADLASLSRRLLEIRKDIEAIDARDEQDGDAGGEAVEDGTFDASAV